MLKLYFTMMGAELKASSKATLQTELNANRCKVLLSFAEHFFSSQEKKNDKQIKPNGIEPSVFLPNHCSFLPQRWLLLF